jgi:hypothetical protein
MVVIAILATAYWLEHVVRRMPRAQLLMNGYCYLGVRRSPRSFPLSSTPWRLLGRRWWRWWLRRSRGGGFGGLNFSFLL